MNLHFSPRKITKKQILVSPSVLFAFIVVFTTFSYVIIQKNTKYMINELQIPTLAVEPDIVIVFGGGVGEDNPLPLVKDRLDTAKRLYDKGLIKKILVSGDNRFLDYNETAVMQKYLIEAGIEENDIQPDYAGRSTYETCERAKKVFGISNAILVSESTHLPRALYLCRHFGIESYGIASNGESSSGLQIGQRWREILARNKALFNVNIYGEKTILGEPIEIN